jgi:hypothetical protein
MTKRTSLYLATKALPLKHAQDISISELIKAINIIIEMDIARQKIAKGKKVSRILEQKPRKNIAAPIVNICNRK